jgi:hypothetical protein
MSNDAKLWATRGVLVFFVLVGLYLLGKIQTAALSEGNLFIWLGLLVGLVVVSAPVIMAHAYFKSRRWTTAADYQKVNIETLAKLGGTQLNEKKKQE